MWSLKGKYNQKAKGVISSLIAIISSISLEPSTLLAISQTQTKTEREFKIFCRDIDPSNQLCQKWFDITKERLSLEGTIRHSINLFCGKSPQHPLCKKSARLSIFTYCSQIDPENNECIKWKSLKQAELEVKGLLADEINKFCSNNSTHHFCRSRKK